MVVAHLTIVTSSAGSPGGAPNKSWPAQAADSEPKLIKPHEVHEAIRGLKVSKAPSPNGIPKRALKRIAHRAISFLAQIFNAVLRTHHFTQVWKHARMIFIP